MPEPGRHQARIIRISGPIDAVVRVPPSKSLTQRALVAAALARGSSVLHDPLRADDTEVLSRALAAAGIRLETGRTRWSIEGCAGRIPSAGCEIDVGAAGTAMRFLIPVMATGKGRFVLDGTERMRRRPVGDLLAALAALGVQARALHGDGCPPVEVMASGLRGGSAAIRGGVSSQFLSGLLLASPCASGDVTLLSEGPLVSAPYVDLTLDVMRRFGAAAEVTAPGRFHVRGGTGYEAGEYRVEGDASSACWWLAAAAITRGRVRVKGVPRASKQGDLGFADLLEEMGCRRSWERDEDGEDVLALEGGSLRGVRADLSGMPDAAPALAAVAIHASSPTRLTGVSHLRAKESDRIAGLASGLAALGAGTEEHRDGLTIRPGSLRAGAPDPLDDHRLAMAFAVAGLAIGGVRIGNPSCVRKSYPGFWETLDSVVATAV